MLNHVASGYTLHLYCKWENVGHVWDEFPHEYFHEHRAKAWAAARKAGWIVHKDRTATCPKCAKKLKEKS
jgi:uncharacterized paraquat-inducible protein A